MEQKLLNLKDLNQMIMGMSIDTARELLEPDGYELLVVRDGKKYRNPGSGFNKARVNVEIDDGIIKKIYIG